MIINFLIIIQEKMIYKWMKEHKYQRNKAIVVGVIETCVCIVYFAWYFKMNNFKINNLEMNNGEILEKYDFQQMIDLCIQKINKINTIVTSITAIVGGSLSLYIKKLIQRMGKIDKEKFSVIGKIRNTYDEYKLMLLSYLQLFIGISEWFVPVGIFYLVVVGMEQMFKLKKQTSFVYLNFVIFVLALSVVIVSCLAYIITKSCLHSAIILTIYCFCILLLIFGLFAKTKMELYMIITGLSIALSWISFRMLHNLNVAEKQGSLRLCISIISRNIVISGFLFGVIILQIPHIYDVTFILYIAIVVIDYWCTITKDNNNLRDVYIEIQNENIRTKGEIKIVGDMVMYTTTDGIDRMIDCDIIKNIWYSYRISKIEQKLNRKKQNYRTICADLKGCRIIADDYKIKNDWIYFYNIYMGEKRVNIYRFSDCIKMADKTKIIKKS